MSEVSSMKQILVNNGIPFKDGKIDFPPWVKHVSLDVGLSFDAPHSQNWLDNNPDLMVFGFEANPFWVKYLVSPDDKKDRSFKDYHTYTKPLQYSNINTRSYIVPVALSNVAEPCSMELYTPENGQVCGSLLRSRLLGNTIQTFDVPVFNISDFFDLFNFKQIEYIDYLKIDVQGMDLEVLKGAGKYLSEYVVYVTAEPEVKQYYGSEGNSVPNMLKYMTELGFTQVDHPNTVDPTFLNTKFVDKKDVYIWQHY